MFLRVFLLLYCVLFPESRSIDFLMLLGLVSSEAVGEGETNDSAEVHVVDDVLPLVGIMEIVVASLENVVAISFHLEFVALERLPGEGGVEITRCGTVDDALDGIGADKGIKIQNHMLAKEEGAIPCCLAEPLATVKGKVVEVGVFVVLINFYEGKAVLPPVADVDRGSKHQASYRDMVEVGELIFRFLLGVALVRKLAERIGRILEEETCHISAVQNVSKREVEVS